MFLDSDFNENGWGNFEDDVNHNFGGNNYSNQLGLSYNPPPPPNPNDFILNPVIEAERNKKLQNAREKREKEIKSFNLISYPIPSPTQLKSLRVVQKQEKKINDLVVIIEELTEELKLREEERKNMMMYGLFGVLFILVLNKK